MACFQIIIQLLIRLLASFCIYGGTILLGIWVEIEGLNQEISYWNLTQVISRVFQVIKNSFKGGFMAWFWTIIQLLIHFTVSFSSCDIKMLHGIWYKLGDWIKRYLIWTYHKLSQEYFKSYIIAFSVALWLDFEQLSSYLFVYRRFYRAAISKCYMEFDTKLEDWINRYLIQTYQRLSQKYFKSYRIAFIEALWLDFEQLSSYLFVYWRLFGAAISKCYMEFDTKLEDWIERCLI